ncbi:MAG: COX15/CtaA family protein [Alphaproteobacteria bacterium]
MNAAAASASSQRTRAARRAIALWLLACCAMIFVMVVIGGLTRLTHSGLSMVEWKPVTGFLPPMTEAAWERAFANYRQFPEYRELNYGMTLAEFKSIFWFEFVHRVWGRAIGVVFLLPFLWFLLRGRIDRWLAPRLVVMFALGALQGGLGWYMVRSGLIDRPDVSHYRLTAHLGAAFLIYGYMFWIALGLLSPPRAGAGAGLARWAIGLAALVVVTALSGGLVAGLDAGFSYNTFPLMDGRLIPEGMLDMKPAVVNLFDNRITVQFDHRVLAIGVALFAPALWFAARRAPLPPRARVACHALLAVVALQVGLGVSTLLSVVWLPLAAAHQAGAMVLFTVALWLVHELRPARAPA